MPVDKWINELLYSNIKYLKHEGRINEVKVSVRMMNREPIIFIRDQEFTACKKALVCLQHIVETEMIADRDVERLLSEEPA